MFQVDKLQYCWLEILSLFVLFVFHRCLGLIFFFFQMLSVLKLEQHHIYNALMYVLQHFKGFACKKFCFWYRYFCMQYQNCGFLERALQHKNRPLFRARVQLGVLTLNQHLTVWAEEGQRDSQPKQGCVTAHAQIFNSRLDLCKLFTNFRTDLVVSKLSKLTSAIPPA